MPLQSRQSFRAVALVVIPLSLVISGCYLWKSVKKYESDSKLVSVKQPLNGTYRRILNKRNSAENVVFIFTGRWEFLRIQLPYLCRDLRQNGGVIDQVWFMMVNYDKLTRIKLTEFISMANQIYSKEVFTMHYFGYDPPNQPPKKLRFKFPYSEILALITEYPENKYFKFDDDIVYIHPKAFSSIINREISNCLIHFFNIAGANWRCSWLHQKLGVYDELNPNQLEFGFDPFAECGWKSTECAELTLNTFLHHYYNNSLDKYFFDTYYITDGTRFSINAFLLDVHTIDMKAILTTSRKLIHDDEKWWSEIYTSNSDRNNCVVGDALVVHFSYFTNLKKLIKNGMLLKFQKLVELQRQDFNISSDLWRILY